MGNNLNSKKSSWIKALYSLFFVVIPSFFIWIFLGNDFSKEYALDLGFAFLVAIGFIVTIFFTTLIIVYFKVVDIYVFSFSIPIALCFMSIYISSYIGNEENMILYRTLIVLPFTFTVIPINMLCNKIRRKSKLYE